MTKPNEIDQMNLTKKEWLIGIIETVTKMLLAVLVYIGAQLITDIRIVQEQNQLLLNKLTEVSTHQANMTERLHANEAQIDKLRDQFYDFKTPSKP
jgi:cell division protein FtsB